MLEQLKINLQKELENLNFKLENIKKEIQILENKLNFFIKYINKKKYKKISNELSNLKNQKIKLEKEIKEIKLSLEKNSLLAKKLKEEISKQILTKAQPEEISELTEIIVLDPNDVKIILENCLKENQYISIEDESSLALVHKTRYLPKKNKIETGRETGATAITTIELSKKKYEIEYRVGQNSIHFALNGPVSDHDYGSWSDCKYAIIIPFDKVDKKNLLRLAPEDTYFEGGVEIPEGSLIFCPKTELSQIEKTMKNFKVIAYDDNVKLDDVIECVLIIKGIKVKDITNDGWYEEYDTDTEILQKINQKYKHASSVPHTYSENAENRNFYTTFSFLINLIGKMIEEKIIVTDEEIKYITSIIKISLSRNIYYSADDVNKRMMNKIIEYTKGLIESLYMYNLIDEKIASFLLYSNVTGSLEIVPNYNDYVDFIIDNTYLLFGNLNYFIDKMKNNEKTDSNQTYKDRNSR